MAACFIACASGVTSAPLNPAYRADEFEFYLPDLKRQGADRRGRQRLAGGGGGARSWASPCIDAGAGRRRPPAPSRWTARDAASAARRHGGSPQRRRRGAGAAHLGHHLAAEDRAAVAGQPGAPRPRTSRRTLRFTPADRGLNIMPLFHIHGLIAGVLAPLSAGVARLLHAGLQRAEVLRAGWTRRSRPGTPPCRPCTRRSCRAPRSNAEVIARHPLRFIRSSSSSMPPQVIAELEAVFGAPLIESLRHDRGRAPDGHATRCRRRCASPASVGLRGRARGGDHGRGRRACWRRGETGEIVIRGPNVTAGYENNPKANAEAFARRLVPHRRPGRDGRRRLPQHHRPAEGDHQPRRREDQPARGRRDPDGPPGGGAGGRASACRTPSSARKWPPPWCCAKARRRPSANCSDFVAPARRRLQGAEEDPDPRRDPQGRHRQAAAHRAARRSWGSDVTRDLRRRRRRHRRLPRREAGAGRRGRHRSSRAAATWRRSMRNGFRLLLTDGSDAARDRRCARCSDPRRCRRAGRRAADREGPSVRDLLPDLRALFGPETAGRDDDQRRAVVVLPPAGRAARRPRARVSVDPGGVLAARHRARTHHRQRRLPGGRAGRAGRRARSSKATASRWANPTAAQRAHRGAVAGR